MTDHPDPHHDRLEFHWTVSVAFAGDAAVLADWTTTVRARTPGGPADRFVTWWDHMRSTRSMGPDTWWRLTGVRFAGNDALWRHIEHWSAVAGLDPAAPG